jgi:hypothetical protein
MTSTRRGVARFLAGRAARIILAGSTPETPPENPATQVNDIILSNLVVREDASNGLVGYLYAIGTTGAVTFSITVDADGIFAIQNGNELHKVDAFGTGTDYAITIKATETVGGAEYSEAFTIDVIPTEDEEDDSGIGGGGGSGDVEIPDDEDPDSDTDPYVEPPVEVVTEVAAKVSGKTGGTSVFLKDWGVPVAGRAYVMKYSADWTGMSAQGRYAAVGFGFKQGNSFHMVGLRGNGAVSTTMLGSRLYGDWRKSKQFTITNDGAATHGTKNGPNWLRLTIGGDGTTYTLESSADGATWAAEITDAAPSPFTDATDATQFGPAAYFYEEDKGTFVISITEFWQKPVNTVAPAITGTPTEGETLTVSDGTWTGAGIAYTRQWKADGVAISGETASTLLLTGDEVGADITADVTATNPGGATTEESNSVGPVEGAANLLLLGTDHLQLNATDLELSTASDDVNVASPGANAAVLTTALLARSTNLRCKVRKSAQQNGANYSAGVTLTWDSEDYDEGGWHDNSTDNSRLTVPAGVTRVDIEIYVEVITAGTNRESLLYLLIDNGHPDGAPRTRRFQSGAGASASADYMRVTDIPVTPGQYLEARLIWTVDTSISITTNSHFAVTATGYSQ